jgi:DNA (cytosine-5)-methyltransferase 1
MIKRVNVIDIFCGASGLSTGFSNVGFNVLLGIDFFESALKTFKRNHPTSKILNEDIRKISGEDIRDLIGNKKIHIVVGGPPCQGFSMAGKRQPNDPRNSLFREYVRLIQELDPEIFVMENVRGLLSMKNEEGEKVIDIILDEFKKIGKYRIELDKVNTADYGVPEKRNRIFIIGYKENYCFKFPSKTHNKNGTNGLKKWMGLKNILEKKNKVNKKYFYSQKLINGFLRREKNNKKKKMGFGWQFLNEDEPSYTISARYYKDGAEALVKYNDSFKEGSIRRLTPSECALIQSFPKSFKFIGSENEIYRQIGNAVPPKMAEAIAKSIKSALNY